MLPVNRSIFPIASRISDMNSLTSLGASGINDFSQYDGLYNRLQDILGDQFNRGPKPF